ncbi:DUF916 domain-containing protein [Dactylosporangium sp. NBC_01737]|uniref:WxL protein peptidoglycan domain-containing protein n=1 Tax=Dactylosporangium sp. NBC_01737 TaxID=2975959 RepID=UPI002E14B36B|nr:DUF916 domain-containing protein [Dactylosporangium sp. NBC_01737]
MNPPRRTARRALSAALAALTGLAAALVVSVPPAHAAPEDEFRWAVTPVGPNGPDGRSRYDYQVRPGTQIQDRVAVWNLGTKAVNFTVYSTDAFTSSDGAFSLLTAAQPAKDLGTWTDLTPKTYTVQPQTRADVAFTINVPVNATPGDHAGGIVASVVGTKNDAGGGQQVDIDRRVASRIYLRVDGPVTPGLAVESLQVDYANPANPFQGADMTVTYRVRNTGNIRVSGTAAVRARGPLGLNLGETGDIEVPEMLPGSEITVTRKISGVFPAVWLTAQVSINPVSSQGRLSAVNRGATIAAPPWALVGVLLLIIAAVALVVWRRRRRRHTERVLVGAGAGAGGG